ncbi:MAG: TIGR02921 family PEP-CTERM protein [Cyanobacteria bacterium J06623_7]
MENIIRLRNFSYHSIFWGWNLIFISIIGFGITPFIGIVLVIAALEGSVSFDFALTFIALVAIPIACTVYGAKYLRKQPKELMRWFYGVEAPLVTWCLVRLFIIREFTLASSLILGTLLVCIVAFAIEVLQGYRTESKVFSWVQAIAHTLMLFTGVYLGAVLLFYAIPVAIYIITGIFSFIVWFFSFDWLAGFTSGSWLFFSVWGLLFLGLFGFSITLFVGMPIAITNLYINSGKKIIKAFSQQHSQKTALQVGVAVVATWLIMFNVFNQQPQIKAFESLEHSPLNRQELLASSARIRQGLINANLYPYRYLSTREGNNHIYEMYRQTEFLKPIASFMQERYNQLLSPFLYQGDRHDVDKSAELYAEFFDTPIQKAERKAIRHALKSTSIVDQAKAGVLNIDQKKVWLAQQEVNIEPHDGWANVEIHEVYENQTTDVEEILYYFSLPESAAITGVWLGESADLDKRFAYQVSPRGAAQQVYNSQVRRTRPVDPALLEQVGTGQYRLRAFPVPPKRNVSTNQNRIKFETPKMHLWLTYQVMQQPGGWALPKLAEKRNIYWTRLTKRLRNGKVKRSLANNWLEDYIAATNNYQPQTHQVNLASDRLTLKPLAKSDYVLPQNKAYALILDTSRSMSQHKQEAIESLKWWRENLQGQFANDVDLYLTDDYADKAKRLEKFNGSDINKLTFYGSLQTDEMLQQFQTLRGGKEYDGVLLLTDEGSYELSKDKRELPDLNAPLWMVHLGGELPRAYADATLAAIQNSNGGVATNIATVMQRLGTEEAQGGSVIDGYLWTTNKSDAISAGETGFKAISARQIVAQQAQKGKNKLSVAELDAIHQIAKDNSIVTPYSSMIVLVNDRQREQLKAAEAQADRFDREVETGTEQLDTPFNPFESNTVSGVPEPNLWILLGIVTLALLIVFQRQKAQEKIETEMK